MLHLDGATERPGRWREEEGIDWGKKADIVFR
jgi:hypothetical protein